MNPPSTTEGQEGRVGQSQASLFDQLVRAYQLANEAGLYDAADFIKEATAEDAARDAHTPVPEAREGRAEGTRVCGYCKRPADLPGACLGPFHDPPAPDTGELEEAVERVERLADYLDRIGTRSARSWESKDAAALRTLITAAKGERG